jgi:hypothetical protein
MTRDPDLIRKVVFYVERFEGPPRQPDVPEIAGYHRDLIGEHVRLAREMGLMDAKFYGDQQSDFYAWCPERLTNIGHDFAHAVREDTEWRRILNAVGPRAEAIALGVISALIGAALSPK